MFRNLGSAVILSTLATAAMAMQGAGAPGTRDELAERLKAYQTAKDCDGMIGLFYTGGIDNDRKSVFERTVRENICANFDRKIASIAFQSLPADKIQSPGAFENRASAYTLTPSGSVLIDYGSAASEGTRSLTFLYGTHDNKTYLVTTKNADAN